MMPGSVVWTYLVGRGMPRPDEAGIEICQSVLAMARDPIGGEDVYHALINGIMRGLLRRHD